METSRRATGYIAVAVIALALIGLLTARYLVKRKLIRNLGTNNMALRVDAARKLLKLEKLSDSLPAQPIIVRSKTAQALGEIGTEEALGVLGEILRDQEEAPRRWARQALVKQGKRAVPVLMAALPVGGGTREETVKALEQIGPETSLQVRFLLSDGSAYKAAAEALSVAGGAGIDALIRGCYNADGDLRKACLSNLGLEKIQAAVEPARYNLRPIEGSKKGAAIAALGLIGARQAVPEIIPFLQDKDNREAAATALGHIGDPRAVEPILATMKETEKRYRNAAILALRRIGPPAFPALMRDLRSSQVLMRRAAAAALVGSKSARVTQSLAAALGDSDAEVRASAALALGWQNNTEAVTPLVGALSDKDWRVVDAAVKALGAIGPAAAQRLLAVLRDPSQGITERYQLARALAAMGRPAVPKLIVALSGPEPEVQKWTAVALGEIGDQQAVPALQRLRETAAPDVQWVVGEQLRRLTRLAGS